MLYAGLPYSPSDFQNQACCNSAEIPVGSFCLPDSPILILINGYGKFLAKVNVKCLLSVENDFSGKIEQDFSKIPVDMLGLDFPFRVVLRERS